ncbi:GntR family transcriptional regulator [Brachybacterium avium]|uniref:GntR family transcriptional regulator n=1 Tax=Brachybacterium avium TaxID=2017485 RepID=A0A220UFB5_9MICO|nr:GntR family transcriptional regulator [Brachybacterium avium]ASK66403.1 GntR family transcriptional regulator [Brachybacterium avium]
MHLRLDPSAPEPIYEQIRARLAEQILQGDLAAGEALPSIRALARDLRVSVITTTRAYNELVADGLVDAVRGKGVFIRAQQPEQLRARALGRIDDALAEALRTARTAGIDDEELCDRLAGLLEEDDR